VTSWVIYSTNQHFFFYLQDMTDECSDLSDSDDDSDAGKLILLLQESFNLFLLKLSFAVSYIKFKGEKIVFHE